jgi:hypothetical protein
MGDAEFPEAPGVAREELAQVEAGLSALVLDEPLPGREGGAGGGHSGRHEARFLRAGILPALE